MPLVRRLSVMTLRSSLWTVLALTLAPSLLSAQDTEWNRYTLEELGGVFVRTEANAMCESRGVSASPATNQ